MAAISNKTFVVVLAGCVFVHAGAAHAYAIDPVDRSVAGFETYRMSDEALARWREALEARASSSSGPLVIRNRGAQVEILRCELAETVGYAALDFEVSAPAVPTHEHRTRRGISVRAGKIVKIDARTGEELVLMERGRYEAALAGPVSVRALRGEDCGRATDVVWRARMGMWARSRSFELGGGAGGVDVTAGSESISATYGVPHPWRIDTVPVVHEQRDALRTKRAGAGMFWVGVGLAIGAGASLGIAKRRHDRYRDPATAVGDRDAVLREWRTARDVGIACGVAAGVGVVTGTVLWLRGRERLRRFTPHVELARTTFGLGLSGRF